MAPCFDVLWTSTSPGSFGVFFMLSFLSQNRAARFMSWCCALRCCNGQTKTMNKIHARKITSNYHQTGNLIFNNNNNIHDYRHMLHQRVRVIPFLSLRTIFLTCESNGIHPPLFHRLSKLEQYAVHFLETDQTGARILYVEDEVKNVRDDGRKQDGVELIMIFGCTCPVACQPGAGKGDRKQRQEDRQGDASVWRLSG